MMFTCGLAADILFYSFAEWIMYATNPHIADLGPVHEWAGVFPLFHWSFIPWAFYLVLAVAFGFMLHVRKRKRQRYSEACRPVIGKHADGLLGRVIDTVCRCLPCWQEQRQHSALQLHCWQELQCGYFIFMSAERS